MSFSEERENITHFRLSQGHFSVASSIQYMLCMNALENLKGIFERSECGYGISPIGSLLGISYPQGASA